MMAPTKPMVCCVCNADISDGFQQNPQSIAFRMAAKFLCWVCFHLTSHPSKPEFTPGDLEK